MAERPSEASRYTLHQLREMARVSRIKGYSRMTKEDLYYKLFREKPAKTKTKKSPKPEPVQVKKSSKNDERVRRLR